MNVKYVLLGLVLVTTKIAYVQSFPWALLPIGASILGSVLKLAVQKKAWVVEVHNEGRHHAHLWCASKNDRIGPKDGLWVAPGNKIAWAFFRNPSTQFWCTMDWWGQRVGWDVYVQNWKDAPNPTKWSIRNDGVYDQWRNRKWRHLNS